LRQSGCPFIIVLGHPEYYPRFDFKVASTYRLSYQREGVPDEAFMQAAANDSALPAVGSIVRYRREFDDAM
jgi:putative acetyltransferase